MRQEKRDRERERERERERKRERQKDTREGVASGDLVASLEGDKKGDTGVGDRCISNLALQQGGSQERYQVNASRCVYERDRKGDKRCGCVQ